MHYSYEFKMYFVELYRLGKWQSIQCDLVSGERGHADITWHMNNCQIIDKTNIACYSLNKNFKKRTMGSSA